MCDIFTNVFPCRPRENLRLIRPDFLGSSNLFSPQNLHPDYPLRKLAILGTGRPIQGQNFHTVSALDAFNRRRNRQRPDDFDNLQEV